MSDFVDMDKYGFMKISSVGTRYYDSYLIVTYVSIFFDKKCTFKNLFQEWQRMTEVWSFSYNLTISYNLY